MPIRTEADPSLLLSLSGDLLTAMLSNPNCDPMNDQLPLNAFIYASALVNLVSTTFQMHQQSTAIGH